MENYSLKNDLKVFYVRAKSFPDGIKQEFMTLEEIRPSVDGRIFFGLSRMEDGTIVHKAAVLKAYEEEVEGNVEWYQHPDVMCMIRDHARVAKRANQETV